MSGEDRSDRFVLIPENGFLRLEWNEGVTVSGQDAQDVVERIEEVVPGLCEPMLANLNSMVSLSTSALAIFARNLNVAALAIVGPSAVDRTIATFFSEVHSPRYPTRYFPQPEAAIDWLLTPGHETPGN